MCGYEREITVTPPEIENGKNAKWVQNSKDGLLFKSATPLSELQSVCVDANPIVEGKQYEARSGSTIIILKPDYLSTLSLGSHEIALNFKSGTATAKFSIEEPAVIPTPSGQEVTPVTGGQVSAEPTKAAVTANSVSPNTSDDDTGVFGYAMLFACIAMMVIIACKKKQ